MRRLRRLVPQWVINYFKHWPLAVWANLYWRFPARKLKVIGVTGTDGKTTTVNLIYEILVKAGRRVAMISTVGAKIDQEEIDTGFHVTAPDSWFLQKLLRQMVNRGIECVVLEATSHGMDQFRYWGVDYEIGVLTNITHEHLDYHQTFENYRRAKLKLFMHSKTVVLNRDDASFDYLKKQLEKHSIKILTYGLKNEADFTPQTFPLHPSLPGEHNLYNCLAAAGAATVLKIDQKIIQETIHVFKGVIGRMEEIKAGQNFRVIVDFAHTPNALEQTLKTLKASLAQKARLVVVFGAAGLRDIAKRPMMGEIAGKYADLVILTAEDPRTEKVEEICRQIAVGCQKAHCQPKIIVDRAKAIEFALRQAHPKDVVVVCGKGHEKSMCYGARELPWSDQETIKKILSLKNQVKMKGSQ